MNTIVYYYQDNCPACVNQDPIYSSVASKYGSNIAFKKVNISGGANKPGFVTGTPAFAVINGNGKIISKNNAPLSANELKNLVSKFGAGSLPSQPKAQTKKRAYLPIIIVIGLIIWYLNKKKKG